MSMKKNLKIGITVLVSVALVVAFIIQQLTSSSDGNDGLVFDDPSQPYVKVHFIDVDQADAVLVEMPGHRTMVIDAGTNDQADKVKAFIEKLDIKKIDYVIGTHPHEDHIGGLDTVIESFDIGRIYMPDVESADESADDVLTAVAAKGLMVEKAAAGVVILDEKDLKIEILAPIKDAYDDVNTYSAVVKLTYINNTFLFTGDATAITEREMMLYGMDLDADVLKVAHHGADTSTCQAFLEAVSPKYAVISVGENNSYGFPAADVSKRLDAMDVSVYRTDKQGTVTFLGNGQRITVKTEK